MRFQVAIIFTAMLVFACSKEPQTTCDTTPCTVELPLSAKAMDYIANYEGADHVVFENSIGEEIIFDIGYESFYGDRCVTRTLVQRVVCAENPEFSKDITANEGYCGLILRNMDKDYAINIELSHTPQGRCDKSFETLNVYSGGYGGTLPYLGGFSHIFANYSDKEYFSSTEILDIVTLNGTNFTNVIVYEPNGDPIYRQFEMLFNTEYGLVGIIDNQIEETYSYVRVE